VGPPKIALWQTWPAASWLRALQCRRQRARALLLIAVAILFLASPATAYIYTVKAVKNEIASAAVGDLATTVVFDDDPVVPRLTKVRAVHVTQLQTAVNAVRALAGLAPESFAAVAVRDRIYASHIQQLRTALAPARSALGLPAVTYARAILEPLMRIWASDVNDTRAPWSRDAYASGQYIAHAYGASRVRSEQRQFVWSK
jgi:hypothetical protein